MSSLSPTRWSEPQVAAEAWASAHVDRLDWRFWLPVSCIAFAMFVSYHDVWFAIEASGEKLRESDLAEAVADSSRLKQLGTLLVGAIGVVLLGIRSNRTVSLFSPLLTAICLLALYTTASFVWSDSPATTLRRAVVPVLLLIGAFGSMRHWQMLDLCRAVVILSTLFLGVGVLAELRYGTFLSGAEYRFSGTLHPNRQALNCALLGLASLTLYAADRRRAWLALACIAFGFLLLTGSRGGTVACLTAIGVLWWLQASGAKRAVVLLTSGVALSLLLLYLAFAPQSGPDWKAIGAMGRDTQSADPTTLTGRIPIWCQVYADASEQAWLGYGYGAFWTSGRVHSYSAIHDNWAFSNAHSIYLEVMANLGLLGVALGLLVVGVGVWRARALLKAHVDPALPFCIAVIVLCAVNGLVEAICVSPGYEFIVVSFGLAGLTRYSAPEAEGAV